LIRVRHIDQNSLSFQGFIELDVIDNTAPQIKPIHMEDLNAVIVAG
jgi:hypothetical protein